jgi:diaminopimelate epimerase
MNVPFVKAHGARNDFLITWAKDAPATGLSAAARAICDRHSGVGADGWLLLAPPAPGAPARLRLFNPDGGEVEMSGNGTRCAAALLIDSGYAQDELEILTGGGLKHLRLVHRDGNEFLFEMNMGVPRLDSLDGGPHGGAIVNVGNPQCAVLVEAFPPGWPALGAQIECDPMFPQRTNVSFVRAVDARTIEARFFERGVGVTESSGTGATGAMVAAVWRGLVQSPVTVQTPAGPLSFRWPAPGQAVLMQGPAALVARGEFHYRRA